MALKTNGRLSRREVLRGLSMLGAGAGLSPFLSGCRDAALTNAQREELGQRRQAVGKPPKFLITIAATGGASIIDSLMAVRASESSNAATLNTFPDASVTNVAGTPFRAVKYQANSLGAIPLPVNADQAPFVAKHKNDLLVTANIGTSVNHVIAQKRSLTGNGAWKGRTLAECVALEYGDGFLLPNVNMAIGGYLERGSDDLLPAHCFSEPVAQASLWPLGLDGMKGIKAAPDRELVAMARALRDQKLDPESVFAKTYAQSPRLKRWLEQRGPGLSKIEAADLITRLNVLPNQPPDLPLTEYGLASSPDAAALRAKFPNFLVDPVEGQAALAFLLIKHRVSCAVTLGPTFNVTAPNLQNILSPPLAFDYSHNDHRGAQAFMWSKMLGLADRLIDLLKAEPYEPGSSQSLWDNTLLYIATDFGRTRNRQANATTFSSGHDMNNGFVMLSPMLKGNTVLGGVDPNTTMTYGFDPETGVADQGKTLSNERDVFAGVLHTLGVDTSGSGLPDAKAFRRNG